uniref:Gibberellic acid methyltransferase n=1 Tax=Ginkgo biloba TaxID=3311 RepID=A0A894TLY5_GINBI|nr:gibberellic acid methyltransferase [Ginkgo biloba]|eukprot:Gb_37750 [translate_table: standard]
MDGPTIAASQPIVGISSVDIDGHKKCSRNYEKWTADLHRILCMQGGDDDGSYARNSEAPASAIDLSKPFLVEAINRMKLFRGESSLRIADLGCATGINTLSAVDFLVENLEKRYSNESVKKPEFEAFFSDLPSNDFNTLFRSLPPMNIKGLHQHTRSSINSRRYYAAGVPGSFYDRLFSTGKLHVAISLSALHWMSKIPVAVVDKNSKAWNQGRAWIDSARKEVVEAYAEQSEQDLKAFLHCRAEEMISGGLLYILMAGRPDAEHPEHQLGDPDSRAKHPFTNSMDEAWDDLVTEGLIDEETRDSFNIPAYMRSIEEVRRAFNQCNAFDIGRIEFQRVPEHSKEKQEEWIRDPLSYGRTKANLVRATLKPMIEAHLGSSKLSEEMFKRFETRAAADTKMLHKTCYYGIIVVFAIRKLDFYCNPLHHQYQMSYAQRFVDLQRNRHDPLGDIIVLNFSNANPKRSVASSDDVMTRFAEE